ncbi:MAG: 1-phosphofructokinase [Eubacterium sp.]|nr:1-phosphofructokinase [Eubacterium sp.]
MIYTVTFNPSLDYIVTVDGYKNGATNRTSSELMLPGGKGLNVSTVLSNLGLENTAIYFSAGFVGREITRLIEESGITAELIDIPEGCSRINVKMKSLETAVEGSVGAAKIIESEINGMGPDIPKDKVEELFDRLDKLMEGDTLVLAGSIPMSMPNTIYSDIMQRLSGRGIRIVVDATGDLLMNVLQYKPFLVKPNNHELGEIFGVELTTKESVVPYAEKLRELGAENVIVSMAGEGAVMAAADGSVILREAPEGKLVNAVGAGDSMVAGFIAGIMEKPEDYDHAFKMGLSAGSASAFSEKLATKEEILTVFNTI